MPKPLRPPPPPTALVPNPNTRKDVQEEPQEEPQEEAQPADERVSAGFLKNAIDKPKPSQP